MVSDDGSELKISNVERQDDGIYSCMAGNSVGAMSADAKLTVRGTEQSNQVFLMLLSSFSFFYTMLIVEKLTFRF